MILLRKNPDLKDHLKSVGEIILIEQELLLFLL